jgi:hypothetical protein
LDAEAEYEPVATMQRTDADGGKTTRIVLDMDGAGMNLVWLTAYEGGAHDGRMQVSIQSDSEHQRGQMIQHFLTREQTTALRAWLNEK